MNAVGNSLDAMGVEQYLLAFLFLVSYSFALSDFTGARGRVYAALSAMTAAIAFASLTDPWMHGVLVVAFALVAMGVFAGISWALWTFLDRPAPAAASADAALDTPAAAAAERRAPLGTQPAHLTSS